jgi:hypothetical protein
MQEFESVFSDWLSHTITVETFDGTGFDGATYLAPVTVSNCMVEKVSRLVRNSSGNEVVSETTIYATPDQASLFTEHTRISVGDYQSTVIKIEVMDVFGLPGHVVVSLE